MDLVFKALSDETRRKILKLLSERDMTAGEIAEKFEKSWATISHHLDVLKQAGLITDERRGKYIVYSLNTTVFQEILIWFMDTLSKREDKDEKLQGE
ncbi:MAG: transcriptional regulator [Dictyoglomus sp. NZ13-RE01]|nr:MAG: transcriptional regulator [Dictyoglomus sp. NZ13-RE01]